MKSPINKVIGFLVAIHLFTCSIIIFFPQSLRHTIIYSVYARYLLPGPFFSESAIGDTYLLSVTLKDENNSWSESVNPTLDNYRKFTLGNVNLMSRSRLDRMVYQQLISKDSVSDKWVDDEEKMNILKLYYKTYYIPEYADSIRLVITHQDSRDFKNRIDTLQIIQF